MNVKLLTQKHCKNPAYLIFVQFFFRIVSIFNKKKFSKIKFVIVPARNSWVVGMIRRANNLAKLFILDVLKNKNYEKTTYQSLFLIIFLKSEFCNTTYSNSGK